MTKAIGFHEQGRRERARKLKRAIAKSMKMAGHTYREIAEALDYSVSTVHVIFTVIGAKLKKSPEIAPQTEQNAEQINGTLLTINQEVTHCEPNI